MDLEAIVTEACVVQPKVRCVHLQTLALSALYVAAWTQDAGQWVSCMHLEHQIKPHSQVMVVPCDVTSVNLATRPHPVLGHQCRCLSQATVALIFCRRWKDASLYGTRDITVTRSTGTLQLNSFKKSK